MRSELRGRSETARSAARGEASAPRRFGSRAALVALLVAQPALPAAAASDKLPALGAPIGATSVSGLSSGAYMAGQIQLAHAKDVVGAGLVAGGPFACAESAAGRLVPYWPTAMVQNAQKALHGCMLVDWGTPDPVELADRAKELASAGEIDSLADLAADKIYLYSGNEDRTVMRPVVEAAKALYRELGVPEKNIALVEGEGGHGFLTEAAGEACALTDKPYVNDCDYDQAKAILRVDLRPACRALELRRVGASSFSTNPLTPIPATGSPTRAWSMCRRLARTLLAAACMSCSMAASRRGRLSATL